MKCPFCSAEDTKVIDSRPAEGTIRRRRQCEKCGKRFTTYERVEVIPLMVIKKDGVREEFDRSKIEKGIFRACHKRPVPVDRITGLVDDIENELIASGEKEIPSSVIGEMVMNKLAALDGVAEISIFNIKDKFKDLDTLLEEINKLAHRK